jgi:hypothetical protein
MPFLHNPKSAKIRLLLAVVLSIIAYLATPEMKSHTLRMLIAWNVGTWAEIIMTWMIILSSNTHKTKSRSRPAFRSRERVDVGGIFLGSFHCFDARA